MMLRQGNDIERLIEEKRELEDLVEQQNQSIKQIRQNNNNNSSMGSFSCANPLKENNAHVLNKGHSSAEQSIDLMSRILQEKENYIGKLEDQMGEMRHELDGLRDKLISVEISNPFSDKSFSTKGATLSNGTAPLVFTNQLRSKNGYKGYRNEGSQLKGAGNNSMTIMSGGPSNGFYNP